MPTPSERLQRIIDAFSPSEMVFKPLVLKGPSDGQSLILDSVITKKKEVKELSDDAELQKAFGNNIGESWNTSEGKYSITVTVEQLWYRIKTDILREYDSTSKRCDATKRKTQQFINDIKVEDKHLPNYLIQVFLKINSVGYNSMSESNREALFEQFESLRRTYGKRS